jgi:hypothetical protein
MGSYKATEIRLLSIVPLNVLLVDRQDPPSIVPVP